MLPSDPGGQLAGPPDGMSWEEWIGTPQWAQRVRLELQAHIKRMDYEPQQVGKYLETLARHEAWRLLTRKDGSPYSTFEEFCEDDQPWGLGTPFKRIKRLWQVAVKAERDGPVSPHGTNQHAGRDNIITSTDRGTDEDYLARRLLRDDPERFDALKRGEYETVHAAAVAAGIVPRGGRSNARSPYLPKDPERAAQRLVERFGSDWCRALAQALTEAG